VNDLNAMKDQAVDLSKGAADRKAEQAARERAAEAAAIIQVASWERVMNRAFKGIVSRPTRHRFMIEAAKRAEREAERG
jgi:hypothetical protein